MKGGNIMNIHEYDILNNLISERFVNQRVLSENTGYSLGTINKSLKVLQKEGYLDVNMHLTSMAINEINEKKPKRAIILAAGFGMRMVPINMETPKALLEIHNECLIERIIRQLHEVEIFEIYIVVGFKKEQFEYLIDEYGVELVVNPDYSSKNNLYSMKLVAEHMEDAYIIPSDIWCEKNLFRKHELYSWYMVNDSMDDDSTVRVNRKLELKKTDQFSSGNGMIGISYILKQDSKYVRQKIYELCVDGKNGDAFWEEALYRNDGMFLRARIVHSADVVEINTYEDLRELDGKSNQLKSDAIKVISDTLKASQDEIIHIEVLKKGMTNRSFMFTCQKVRYIMRIPGEGTDKLIDRKQETEVYQTISPFHLSDDIFYIDAKTGYKISRYIENARVCNPMDARDVEICINKLREFHQLELSVGHEFDLFGQIDFYESLWGENKSVYRDYEDTKHKVKSLRNYIDEHVEKKVLTHIDAVPDNFIISKDQRGNTEIRLIDWEYAGMQDPHVDIAMFCIYSMYNRNQIDDLIDLYFCNKCKYELRIKIYCYISVCGLLWSNWCEYKRNLGVEFGEYSLKQYRYAKDYYNLAKSEMEKYGLEGFDE